MFRGRSHPMSSGGLEGSVEVWLRRNAGAVWLLGEAQESDTLFLRVDYLGGPFRAPVGAEAECTDWGLLGQHKHVSDWGLCTTVFASESARLWAREARWRVERLLWCAAHDKGSAFASLPPEVVRAIAGHMWQDSPYSTQALEGPSARFPRAGALTEIIDALDPQTPCLLLLKLGGEASVRPLVWLPDEAAVRRKMSFARIPDVLLRALEHSLGDRLCRRANLNEDHIERYMRNVCQPVLREWHESRPGRTRMHEILSASVEDYGDEVGAIARRAHAALAMQ